MKNDKIDNSEQGLELIQRMIKTAQQGIEDESFYYLLWGWVVFAACTLNYILMNLGFSHSDFGWLILMPAAGVASYVYGIRKKKRIKVKSYIDSLMKYVLISFLVSLSMVLFFMWKLQMNTYPMIMMVYGFWLFSSGGALKFKPLILGGIINWILAAVSFFVDFEHQLIILATAVLLGYIIPGHMLKNKFKNVS